MTDAGQTASQLISQNQGLVHSLAWRIHRKLAQHVELDDLVGYGQVGLAEAARDFDPERGVKFTTFAYYRIRGAILDGVSQMNWFKRSDYYRGRYERLANEVLHLQGFEREEASAQLESDVRWLRGMSSTLAVVYLFCQNADDERQSESLADASATTPQTAAIESELRQKLRELVEALPEEAGRLIRAAYFEGLSLKEAGERLGISKSWASRLHARTLDQLARSLKQLQMTD